MILEDHGRFKCCLCNSIMLSGLRDCNIFEGKRFYLKKNYIWFSDNGIITWTISNFREKIQNAKLKNENAIISDTFYNTRPGYNLSLKIFPNGDGPTKDKFISIYIVINKGDYDDEVSWPFKCKIRLVLLSNINAASNITNSMMPDYNTACYGRPGNNPNRAAGQDRFLPISDILNKDTYLHGNSLKIRLTLIRNHDDPLLTKLST